MTAAFYLIPVPQTVNTASVLWLRVFVQRLFLSLISVTAASSLALSREPDWQAIDKNENGMIELSEIPHADLLVVSRYASLAGLNWGSPMPISELRRGSALYIQNLCGDGAELELAGQHGFGRLQQSRVRPFGQAGDYVAPYNRSVRAGTITVYQKFDANRDGLLTEAELGFAYRSNAASWMRGDGDANRILTFIELANAVTAEHERRRGWNARDQSTWTVDGIQITPEHRSRAARMMTRHDKNKNRQIDADEIPKDWRETEMLRWSDRDENGRISRDELQFGTARLSEAEAIAAERNENPDMRHCGSVAGDMIARFDLDKDGSLSRWEWSRIGGAISGSDTNQNELISRDELIVWLYERLQSPVGGQSAEFFPDWFVEADSNRDGQVSLAEFSSNAADQPMSDFLMYDHNDDGLVTLPECGRRSDAGKLRYESLRPTFLEAEKAVESEINIKDRLVIADIDVNVSISKDGDDDLELRLIGPSGETAALFFNGRWKPWGGGRLFDDTLIDDEAPKVSQRLPQPPHHRSFRPQGMSDRRQNSLSIFYGKQAQGNWRLVVSNKSQNRGRRAGLLRGWALLIKPRS